MTKHILFLLIVFVSINSLNAKQFYIDPINGSISNNGSINNPWRSFEEVISSNLIKSYQNSPLPYNKESNILIAKNENAPVFAGDTIILLNGLHGDVFLRNYNNIDDIVVMAAEGHTPIFKSLRIQACSHWKFIGIDISSEPFGEYINNKLVFIESHNWQGPSKLIEIAHCNIYSTTTPWKIASEWVQKASDGIFILGDSISIIDNKVSNINMGISLVGDHIIASNNDIINFSGDGMRILGSDNLVEYNVIKNCYKVDENHDDGIQSFTTNGLVVDNNTVRSNIILNYEDPNQPLLGSLQGMGFFDGPYNGWTIENNVISVNHYHGITFLGAHGCKIINNTVLDPSPDTTPGSSWIMIDDQKNGTASTNCIVKNNVANKIIVDALSSHNIELLNLNEYSDNFIDYSIFDFHLKAGSSLIDAGDPNNATEQDIENTPRTYGSAPDIGAYEFVFPNYTKLEFQNLNNSIYPNPVLETLNLKKLEQHTKYIITNSCGTIVLKGCTARSICVESLSPGQYFINLNNNNSNIGLTFIKI